MCYIVTCYNTYIYIRVNVYVYIFNTDKTHPNPGLTHEYSKIASYFFGGLC